MPALSDMEGHLRQLLAVRTNLIISRPLIRKVPLRKKFRLHQIGNTDNVNKVCDHVGEC